MYLFISENEVMPYNGEVLKRYIGKRLVKTISNPTEEELKEFGYMKLIESENPEYDSERQYLDVEYEVVDGVIHSKYIVIDLPELDEIEK